MMGLRDGLIAPLLVCCAASPAWTAEVVPAMDAAAAEEQLSKPLKQALSDMAQRTLVEREGLCSMLELPALVYALRLKRRELLGISMRLSPGGRTAARSDQQADAGADAWHAVYRYITTIRLSQGSRSCRQRLLQGIIEMDSLGTLNIDIRAAAPLFAPPDMPFPSLSPGEAWRFSGTDFSRRPAGMGAMDSPVVIPASTFGSNLLSPTCSYGPEQLANDYFDLIACQIQPGRVRPEDRPGAPMVFTGDEDGYSLSPSGSAVPVFTSRSRMSDRHFSAVCDAIPFPTVFTNAKCAYRITLNEGMPDAQAFDRLVPIPIMAPAVARHMEIEADLCPDSGFPRSGSIAVSDGGDGFAVRTEFRKLDVAPADINAAFIVDMCKSRYADDPAPDQIKAFVGFLADSEPSPDLDVRQSRMAVQLALKNEVEFIAEVEKSARQLAHDGYPEFAFLDVFEISSWLEKTGRVRLGKRVSRVLASMQLPPARVPEVARYLAGRSAAIGAICLALRLGLQTPEMTRLLIPDIEKELAGNACSVASQGLLVMAFRDADAAMAFFVSVLPGRDLMGLGAAIAAGFKDKDNP